MVMGMPKEGVFPLARAFSPLSGSQLRIHVISPMNQVLCCLSAVVALRGIVHHLQLLSSALAPACATFVHRIARACQSLGALYLLGPAGEVSTQRAGKDITFDPCRITYSAL